MLKDDFIKLVVEHLKKLNENDFKPNHKNEIRAINDLYVFTGWWIDSCLENSEKINCANDDLQKQRKN